MDFNGVFTGKLHSDHRTPLCGFLTIFLILNFGTKFGNYLWRHNVNQDCHSATKKCRISQATILPSFMPFGKFFTSLWPMWEKKHLFLTIAHAVTAEGGSNIGSWAVLNLLWIKFEPSALAFKRIFWNLNGIAVVTDKVLRKAWRSLGGCPRMHQWWTCAF